VSTAHTAPPLSAASVLESKGELRTQTDIMAKAIVKLEQTLESTQQQLVVASRLAAAACAAEPQRTAAEHNAHIHAFRMRFGSACATDVKDVPDALIRP
jgi:hypothetical protein